MRDVLVFQLQLLARRMRRVDDEHVRPLDEAFQNLRRMWRFQIESQSPLVAIVQVPGIIIVGLGLRRNLIADSPGVTRWRFDLDNVRAKVGQDHRGAGPAMKLDRSTTFNPEKIFSVVIGCLLATR